MMTLPHSESSSDPPRSVSVGPTPVSESSVARPVSVTFGVPPVSIGYTTNLPPLPPVFTHIIGEVATGSGEAFPGVVTAVRNIAVAGPAATGSGEAFPGFVGLGADVHGEVATGSGEAFAGSVFDQRNITIEGPVATGTGMAPDGNVIGTGAAAVAGPTAEGTGEAFAGTVTTGVTVGGQVASATGQAFAGSVFDQRNINVTAPLSTGVGQAFAGSVTIQVSVSLAGALATGSGQAYAGSVKTGVAISGPVATGSGVAPAGVVKTGTKISGPVATGSGQAFAGTVFIQTFARQRMNKSGNFTPSQNSTQTVTGWTSDASAPCTITGDKMVITGGGNVTVTLNYVTSGFSANPTVRIMHNSTIIDSFTGSSSTTRTVSRTVVAGDTIWLQTNAPSFGTYKPVSAGSYLDVALA